MYRNHISTPVFARDAATKEYVDKRISASGGIVGPAGPQGPTGPQGPPGATGAPGTPSDTTKAYVDTQDALKVSKTGDTMTGALTLPGPPSTALQASTKKYVDDLGTYLDGAKVAKAGDTMTGSLTVNGAVTVASDNLYIARSVVATGGVGQNYNLDATQNVVTAAAGALVCIIWNFSGMVLMNSHGNGHVDLFICGAGNALRVSSIGGACVSPSYAPDQNGYAFYNATGGTSTFGIMVFRSRPGA